jgi:hypothetical protein
MRSKALPRPQNRNGDSHRCQGLPQPTTTPTAKKSPCQKGTRCRRSTPHLHVLPHGGRNTEGPPHDQGGLRRRSAVPVQTPHHGGSQYNRIKGALHPPPERRHQSTPKAEALRHGTPSPPPPPPQTHVASPPGGLPDLPAKRPKECLLQGREGFNNHKTHCHDDHQPPDPTATDAGMANQRRDHAPNLVGRQRRSDLATIAKQHRLDQL